jgi:hypothetical protein
VREFIDYNDEFLDFLTRSFFYNFRVTIVCKISVSHGDECEDGSLPERCAVCRSRN